MFNRKEKYNKILTSLACTGAFVMLAGLSGHAAKPEMLLKISAGVEVYAPEETEGLEQALSLVDQSYIDFLVKYRNTAVAVVNGYVNVREHPDTESKIVGKVYDGSAVTIIEEAGEDDSWYHITSGSVNGYVKQDFFMKEEQLYTQLDEYLYKYVEVNTSGLNVRSGPGEEFEKVTQVSDGKRYERLEQENGYVRIYYSGDNSGWVSEDYITMGEEFFCAVSIEEELRAAAEKEAAEQVKRDAAKMVVEATKAQNGAVDGFSVITPPELADGTNQQEIRQQIVDYAMQYLGYPYKHGGKSLEATDCSGFTCFIYAAFGYAIDRTPGGQYNNAGTAISYDQIQKGDIICYGSNSKITHVALYIGDGMIIHEANSRKGVVIYEADYDDIVGIKNVIG